MNAITLTPLTCCSWCVELQLFFTFLIALQEKCYCIATFVCISNIYIIEIVFSFASWTISILIWNLLPESIANKSNELLIFALIKKYTRISILFNKHSRSPFDKFHELNIWLNFTPSELLSNIYNMDSMLQWNNMKVRTLCMPNRNWVLLETLSLSPFLHLSPTLSLCLCLNATFIDWNLIVIRYWWHL